MPTSSARSQRYRMSRDAVRSATHDRIRLRWRSTGWSHNSIVRLALVEAHLGATSGRFHQELLADATERAVVK
jgi:hypothetical protein